MPVRSLRSSVLRWPDAAEVRRALTDWAALQMGNPVVAAVGWFGSYARGDWGVGSDLDLVLLVRQSDQPLVRRAAGFDTSALPVPVDLLVYTEAEWAALVQEKRRFVAEVEWLAGAAPGTGPAPARQALRQDNRGL